MLITLKKSSSSAGLSQQGEFSLGNVSLEGLYNLGMFPQKDLDAASVASIITDYYYVSKQAALFCLFVAVIPTHAPLLLKGEYQNYVPRRGPGWCRHPFSQNVTRWVSQPFCWI